MGKSKSQLIVSRELDPNYELKTFFKDPNWMAKTAFGGIAYVLAGIIFFLNNILFPLSVAIIAFTVGYLLKVIRTKVNDSKANLPDFGDPLSILFSGLSWFAMQSIVVVLFIATTLSVIAFLPSAKPPHLPIIVAVAAGIWIFFAMFLNMLSAYLMVNFSVEEKVSSGLAFIRVMKIIRKNRKDMICAWLLTVAIQMLVTIIPIVTLIGICLLPYALFGGQLINALLLAQVWPKEDK